jgi:hypothetical protein
MSDRLMAWLGLLAAVAGMTGCGRAATAPAESAQLAALINDDYRGLTLTLISKDFFGVNSVIRTQDLQLDQGFHLNKRFELCDVSWADDFLNGKYKMSDRTHLDCDAKSHGLKWERRTESIDLAIVDPDSIEIQGTPEQRARLRFGYRDNQFATSYLECRNHSACVRMLGNFTALVRLAASPRPATARSTTPTSERAKNIIALMGRINAQYAGAQSSSSTMAFKGQSATLEPQFVLTFRDLQCDGDRNPRYKDLEFEIASALRTKLLRQLVADCDARRDGLAWQASVQRLEFKNMRYPKFEVVKHDDGRLGTRGVRLTTLQRGVEGFSPDAVVEAIISIACKDQRGCEQMAKDLDALANAVGVPRGNYVRPQEDDG